MLGLQSVLNYCRWLHHSCWRWRSDTAVLLAPETRILSRSRKIRPRSVSAWELRRQTSVLLRAIFCRIQKLHRYGTEHSLVTKPFWLHFVCVISFYLSRFFFGKSPPILSVNLRLAGALFETACQLLILASLHLHCIEHLSITHRVLVNVTHAWELKDFNSWTNSVIFAFSPTFHAWKY